MKSPKEKFTIAKPCQENWTNMLPEEKGKFCQVCSKSVMDFTNQSIDKILTYFKNNKDPKTCGRFSTLQLRMLNAMPPKSSPKWKTWLAVFTGLVSVASLNSCNVESAPYYNSSKQEQSIIDSQNNSLAENVAFYIKNSLDSTAIVDAEIKILGTKKVFYSDKKGKVMLTKDAFENKSIEIFIQKSGFEARPYKVMQGKMMPDIYLFPRHEVKGKVACDPDEFELMGEVEYQEQ